MDFPMLKVFLSVWIDDALNQPQITIRFIRGKLKCTFTITTWSLENVREFRRMINEVLDTTEAISAKADADAERRLENEDELVHYRLHQRLAEFDDAEWSELKHGAGL